MEGWVTNPGQDNNQVPNYLPIGKRITRLQPLAESNENDDNSEWDMEDWPILARITTRFPTIYQ
jgi:hypothetical protein